METPNVQKQMLNAVRDAAERFSKSITPELIEHRINNDDFASLNNIRDAAENFEKAEKLLKDFRREDYANLSEALPAIREIKNLISAASDHYRQTWFGDCRRDETVQSMCASIAGSLPGITMVLWNGNPSKNHPEIQEVLSEHEGTEYPAVSGSVSSLPDMIDMALQKALRENIEKQTVLAKEAAQRLETAQKSVTALENLPSSQPHVRVSAQTFKENAQTIEKAQSSVKALREAASKLTETGNRTESILECLAANGETPEYSVPEEEALKNLRDETKKLKETVNREIEKRPQYEAVSGLMSGHETIRDAVLNADRSTLSAAEKYCLSNMCPEEIGELFWYNSDLSGYPVSVITNYDIRKEERLLTGPMQVSPDMVFDEDGFIYKRNGEQSHNGNFYRMADPVYVISQDGRVMQVSVDDIPDADLKNALIESTVSLYHSLGESEPEWVRSGTGPEHLQPVTDAELPGYIAVFAENAEKAIASGFPNAVSLINREAGMISRMIDAAEPSEGISSGGFHAQMKGMLSAVQNYSIRTACGSLGYSCPETVPVVTKKDRDAAFKEADEMARQIYTQKAAEYGFEDKSADISVLYSCAERAAKSMLAPAETAISLAEGGPTLQSVVDMSALFANLTVAEAAAKGILIEDDLNYPGRHVNAAGWRTEDLRMDLWENFECSGHEFDMMIRYCVPKKAGFESAMETVRTSIDSMEESLWQISGDPSTAGSIAQDVLEWKNGEGEYSELTVSQLLDDIGLYAPEGDPQPEYEPSDHAAGLIAALRTASEEAWRDAKGSQRYEFEISPCGAEPSLHAQKRELTRIYADLKTYMSGISADRNGVIIIPKETFDCTDFLGKCAGRISWDKSLKSAANRVSDVCSAIYTYRLYQPKILRYTERNWCFEAPKSLAKAEDLLNETWRSFLSDPSFGVFTDMESPGKDEQSIHLPEPEREKEKEIETENPVGTSQADDTEMGDEL